MKTRDSVGARESSQLLGALTEYAMAHRLFLFGGFPEVLMSDPNAPPGEPFVKRDVDAPGVRAQLAAGAVIGQCYNGREILFGPSRMRDALIARVRSEIADMPMAVAYLDTLAAEAARTLPRRPGLLGLRGRLAWCVGQGFP